MNPRIPLSDLTSSRPAFEAPHEPGLELTILMPCLNEAETLEICILKAQAFLEQARVAGEVLIADNGSTDGSIEIAERLGARVVRVPVRGYGGALMGGIAAARGRFVIMGDADDSYDFSDLSAFLGELRSGRDLVVGNRFRGGIEPGAMPPLHRYLGNPVLSFLGRLFFHIPLGDFHCGLRGFSRDAILGLRLQTTGMEFASEMIVRASLEGLDISEVPTTLKPDGRSRPPHLKTWRDGWRHLKFLLMFSPRWLYAIPGGALTGLGLVGSLLLLQGPVEIGGVVFDLKSFVAACLITLIGMQVLTFGALATVHAVMAGLLPPNGRTEMLARYCRTDELARVALGLLVAGGAVFGYAVMKWAETNFGAFVDPLMPRLVTAGLTLVALGIQVGFAAFLFGILELKSARPEALA